jgi:hypothetical protein
MINSKPFRFAFAVAATAVLALAAGPAFAHAKLLSEVPAADGANAVQPASTPLTDLRLSFSEALNLAFCKLAVTDSAGKAVVLGALALDAQDDRVLLAPLAGPLAAGDYKVDWTVVSNDGHKSNGSYTFKAN